MIRAFFILPRRSGLGRDLHAHDGSRPRRLLQKMSVAFALCLSAPALAAFTVNGDGTVTDTETGLIWDRCTWGQTGADCDGGAASTHTWSQALGVAITANTANHKGHNDWRLPNRTELESLVDITRWNPAIDTSAFPNTVSNWYWSSTSYTPFPAFAWYVHFDYGYSFGEYRVLNFHVRLVRRGQSFDALASTSHGISATASPSGGGSVTCNPNPVPEGGEVTCTATANAGFTFAAWGGDCAGQTGATCVLSNVTAPVSVSADFSAAQSQVTQPIPVLGPWGLALLSGLLGVAAWGRRRP